MKRRVSIVIIITVIAFVLVAPTAAVSFEEAREGDEILRKVYLEQLIRKYTPPGEINVAYNRERHKTAIMSVNYYPISPEDKGEKNKITKIEVYPQAFEVEIEDNFISTLLHEYNHVRVFLRSEIIDENKDYFRGSKYFNVEWKDLYERERYANETLTGEEVSDIVFYQTVRTFIRSEISEMLALEEEIHLAETGVLTPSKEWRDSRYERYVHHFLEMYAALNVLDAEKSLKDILTSKFYRPWFSQKVENYGLKKALYGFSN